MIRAAALVIVLTLAATPAATAACLLWCESPCPASMPQSASAVTGPQTCAESMVTAPVLREDSQRERVVRAIAHVEVALPHALFSAGLETLRVARVFTYSEPPPGHQKPPTVLRL